MIICLYNYGVQKDKNAEPTKQLHYAIIQKVDDEDLTIFFLRENSQYIVPMITWIFCDLTIIMQNVKNVHIMYATKPLNYEVKKRIMKII